MDEKALYAAWKSEEDAAHIHGWDFSHIHGRYEEENDLPWDYEAVVRSHLSPQKRILDFDTGGGEFLLSLHHPHAMTAATEGYSPNVALCERTLRPLGIDFRPCDDASRVPFSDASFDLVLNRPVCSSRSRSAAKMTAIWWSVCFPARPSPSRS